MMASTAASKWSMSVHSDERLTLRLKIQARRWYYVLCIPVIVFYCIILCGCVSKAPLIPTIYLAELREPVSGTILRVGYYGVCSKKDTSAFHCASSILSTTNKLVTLLDAPHDLLHYSISLQRALSYVTLTTAAATFLAGLHCLAALQIILRKQKSSLLPKVNTSLDRHVKNLTIATRVLLWASSSICLNATYSTRSGISALRVATSSEYGTVLGGRVARGVSLDAMQWTLSALSIAFSACVQIATGPKRPQYTSRKSKLGPLMTEKQEETIRIMSPPGHRLALIGSQNTSENSIADQAPRRSNSMKTFIPPEQFPPLATLQRKPTVNRHAEERPMSPLLPGSIIDGTINVTGRPPPPARSRSQKSTRSQKSAHNTSKGTIEEKPLLSPIMPLQGILKISTPPSTPGVHSPATSSPRLGPSGYGINNSPRMAPSIPGPTALSPRPGQKNVWL